MTVRYSFAISPRLPREFCLNVPPSETKGRRECRAPNAPAASRVEKNTRVSHHGHAGSPGIPRAMVLTVSFALSPVIGMFVTVIPKKLTSQELDAGVEASGPHDFAVRKVALSSGAPPHVHRIPPYVRDDRETPLVEERDGWGCKNDLRKKRSGIFLQRGLDRANQLDASQEIRF
jgi:hypothetical protein